MAKKRAKQQFIPGTEPPSIPALDEAAEKYVGIRDDRMRLTKAEAKAIDELLDLLREHGLASYEFDGNVVEISHKDKVKVRRKKEGGDDGEG